MARGFESKDVEFQQAEASRTRMPGRSLTPAERELAAKRRSVELALTRLHAERTSARNAVHQQMLDRAIQDLQAQLAALS